MSFPVRRIAAVTAILLPLSQVIVAQQDTTRRAVTLDPITVTAERRPTKVSAATAPVRVVEQREIQRRPAPDVLTLLTEIPGIQLDRVVGSGAGVSLQGLGSDRVLILLDGVPLAGRLNGQLDLTRISPSQLARIEIVDGPQSTLYGSSALGGVVNLITRRDLGNRGELGASAGSFGERLFRGRATGLLGGAALSLDLGRRTVDLVPGRTEAAVGFANRWDGMARVSRAFGPHLAELRLLRVEENQEYKTGASSTNQNDNWQTDILAGGTLGPAGATELRAHLSLYDHRLVTRNAAQGSSTTEWSLQRLADLEGVHRAHWGDHQFVLGARAERDWISSPRLRGGERASWGGALFGSAEWRVAPSLALSTGARVTSSSQWGGNVAPRLGLLWQAPGAFYAKAGVARGFRAPSFNELYLDFLNTRAFYAVRGNPSLTPEHSWNLTGEVGIARPDLSLHLRGYGNRLRDFVETAVTGDSSGIALFTYRNVGRARTAGAEAGGTVARGDFTLSGAYAFLNTENESTGEALFGRAAHTARGSIAWARRGTSLRAEVVGSGRVPLSKSAAGVTVYQAASTRINLGATLSLSRGLSLAVGVDNLGDEVPAGALSSLGRRWYGGLTWGIGR